MTDWWQAPLQAVTSAADYPAQLATQLLGGKTQPPARPQQQQRQAPRPMSDNEAFGNAGAPAPMSDAEAFGAPQGQPDFGTGFVKGLTQPWANASTWVRNSYRAIPGEQAVDPEVQTALGAIMPLMPEGEVKANQQFVQNQAAQGKTPGFWGGIVGNAASTLPVALAVKSPTLGGGIIGAMSTDHPDDPMRIAQDAATGAIGGKVGSSAASLVAGALSPVIRPAVQTLMDAGVDKLSPGQILGGGWQWAEDALSHLPVGIKGAQAKSVLSFNRAGYNQALAPIGETLPDTIDAGHAAVDYVSHKLGQVFEDSYPKMMSVLDQDYHNGVATAASDLSDRPPAIQQQFSDIVKNNVDARASEYGFLSGDAMGAADSRLGMLSRQYSKSSDVDQQALGRALEDTQTSLRDLAMRQNPSVAPDLQNARAGWANLVRLRNAAGGVGAREGVFTPGQLTSAVQRADPRGFQTGDALMQPFAQAGQSVLPRTVPDSGTISHGLATGAVLGEAAHAINPAAIAATGGLAALYSDPGLAVARAMLTARRPAPVQALGAGLRAFPEAWTIGGANAAPMIAQALISSQASQ